MAENNQEKKTAFVLKKEKRPKKVLLAGIFAVFSLIAFLFLILALVFFRFSRLTNLSFNQVLKSLSVGFRYPYQKDYLTILVLGLDEREGGRSLLTDTILLAAVNAKNGNYLLFSVPRDLWLSDLQTKINALYYYGNQQDPKDGTKLVKEKLEEILSWPIDYVVLFKMEQISDLVDRLGGIEVEVERSFTDKQFPKDDGSNQVKTISFEAGNQTLSGERALEFMRSRQSEDQIEGTDEARQKRQKKVILALQKKLLSQKSLWLDLDLAAGLFNFAAKEIKSNPQLDLAKLASFWKIGKAVAFGGQAKELELGWQEEEAILKAQREPETNAWILTPKKDDWRQLAGYFKDFLP